MSLPLEYTMAGYEQVIVDIKDYVYRYKITRPEAWQSAQIALLDALGCAIETVHKSTDCSKMFGPWALGTVVPSGFRLPGTSHILDPVKGAFDLGTAIRYLDHNDAIAGADWGHPSGKPRTAKIAPAKPSRQSRSDFVRGRLAVSLSTNKERRA
jgi:2-methylcitrate dehydratase PrpD